MSIPSWQSRTALLLNEASLQKLQNAHVLVVGLGGVGGTCAEMLVRAGIGTLSLVDGDVVEASNRNRQLVALCSNESGLKTESMATRLLDINPNVRLNLISEHLNPEAMSVLPQAGMHAIADCIDTLSPKVSLIKAGLALGIPVISAMGAGGMTDPVAVKVGDISETKHCKLAYYVRKRLHRDDIRTGFRAVYSTEIADYQKVIEAPPGNPKKSIIGTISYMPTIFGATVAAETIRMLLNGKIA